MKKIGVIGAGVMGTGVAQNFAQFGYEVVLVDLNEEILNKGKEEIFKNLRFFNMFNKNKTLSKEYNIDDIMKKIRFTVDYEALKEVDFIIENVPEVLETKKKVYEKLCGVCKEDCIYLVNTSCISITKIASFTQKPENVIGVHFMNPVPIKNTVEAIRGYHTSEDTIEEVKKLLNSINKEFILVNDYPGFVSNRISHLLMNEAAYIVQDNVASPKDVDDIFKKCFEHKMGPLETADLIGLDTVVDSLEILYESYQDPKFRCCPLLKKMVDAGVLGRKSGKGFYDYI